MAKEKTKSSIFSKIGPGFITGAADDDPSGIATYSQTGAQFGFGHLWVALFSLPFMIVVQEMCGRIGLVTGKGLSGVIKLHYSKAILYGAVFLVFLANTVNIGADLGAMAASTHMVVPGIPFAVWLFAFVAIIILLEVFLSYRVYARFLQILALSLLAYVATAFISHPNWLEVFHKTLIPHFEFNSVTIMNIVAILGTTISPYLFFWQASEEVEEDIDKHRLRLTGRGLPKIRKVDVADMRTDTFIGMFFSNAVMFFIIVTAGATLFSAGISNIDTPVHAAEALLPLAGPWAYWLFTVGVVGVGLLAIPILAGSASYAVSEAIGWRTGLYNKFKQAHGFYGVIIVATVVGLLVNLTPIPPFTLLYYTAALNGLCAPFLMGLIVLVAGNSKIMGKYKSPVWVSWLGWLITAIMTVAGIALIYDLLSK